MSMKSYPLQIPLAFVIDEEVAAYLMLKRDQKYGPIPENVQKLLDANDFFAAVLRRDKVLADEEYFDISNASNFLRCGQNIEHCFAPGFEGTVNYLDRNLNYTRTEGMNNDFIAVIEPRKQASLFQAAYASLDEPIEEFQETLALVGVFPENFDWASKLVAVDGTYFC